MTERITTSVLKTMLIDAALSLRENSGHLSQLDSVAGDGDHGTTMLRVAEQLEAAVEDASSQSPATLLKNCGLRVLGVDGGASSALLGMFFRGMGDGAGEEDPDCEAMVGIFESGMNELLRQTSARAGDKTMVDALVPAVNALRIAAQMGKPIPAALEDAATAARAGADYTKTIVARCGRARFLGEKTLGHADAGATSVALLFHGFSEALVARREKDHGGR